MKTDAVVPMAVLGLVTIASLQILFPVSWWRICAWISISLAAVAAALYFYATATGKGDR